MRLLVDVPENAYYKILESYLPVDHVLEDVHDFGTSTSWSDGTLEVILQHWKALYENFNGVSVDSISIGLRSISDFEWYRRHMGREKMRTWPTKTTQGNTALILAVFARSGKLVSWLLQAKADPNKDLQSKTTIDYANENLAGLQMHRHFSPLRTAISRRHHPSLKLLLEYKADVSKATNPLSVCAMWLYRSHEPCSKHDRFVREWTGEEASPDVNLINRKVKLFDRNEMQDVVDLLIDAKCDVEENAIIPPVVLAMMLRLPRTAQRLVAEGCGIHSGVTFPENCDEILGGLGGKGLIAGAKMLGFDELHDMLLQKMKGHETPEIRASAAETNNMPEIVDTHIRWTPTRHIVMGYAAHNSIEVILPWGLGAEELSFRLNEALLEKLFPLSGLTETRELKVLEDEQAALELKLLVWEQFGRDHADYQVFAESICKWTTFIAENRHSSSTSSSSRPSGTNDELRLLSEKGTKKLLDLRGFLRVVFDVPDDAYLVTLNDMRTPNKDRIAPLSSAAACTNDILLSMWQTLFERFSPSVDHEYGNLSHDVSPPLYVVVERDNVDLVRWLLVEAKCTKKFQSLLLINGCPNRFHISSSDNL